MIETKPKPSDVRIVMQGVTKSFGKTAVLRNLDWSINRGSVVGLLGVNGAGKSTLLRCLLGLLRPDAGMISIDGEDVWNLSPAIKGRLGFVDQHPKLYPWMCGAQLLQYLGAHYPHWNESLIADLAARWAVPLNKRFASLSPGEQQKVALLAALANEPDLLVLDEPVSSLDPIARREFLRSLLELAAEQGRTILFSTHITSDLERVASHVAIIDGGQIRWFDELDNLKDRTKRWRIRSRVPLPQDLFIPGALHTQVQDRTATLVATDVSDRTLAELSERFQAEIDVEDLNLEEIFLQLHGGKKSP